MLLSAGERRRPTGAPTRWGCRDDGAGSLGTTELRRRRVAAPLAFVLLVAIIAGAAFVSLRPRSDGPLARGLPFGTEILLGADEQATWGVPLPGNTTQADIVIKAIEPVDIHGIDLLGLDVHDPAIDGSVVSAIGYPLEGFLTRPVTGSRLVAGRTDGWTLELLVGARLEPGASRGSIKQFRVLYESGGVTYELLFPAELSLVQVGGE